LALAAPENFHDAVKFATPVAYQESQIAKLAPSVPTDGCLLVSELSDRLSIWGFGRSWPRDTVTIEISEPGTVRVGIGIYRAFAVFKGRSDLVIASTGIDLVSYLQGVLKKTLPADDFIEQQAVWRECFALVDLARMIIAAGHGGAVLIVPSETGEWLETLKSFVYRFAAPDTTIRDAIRQELKDTTTQAQMIQRLSQVDMPEDLKNDLTHFVVGALAQRPRDREWGLRPTASLAGVDGAIVMTQDLRVLGFGAKIVVPADKLTQVCMVQPLPDSQELIPSPLENVGGTRHQSAARFTAVNKSAVAVVISQDRHVSVMHWHEPNTSVTVMRNVEWLI